MLQGVYKLKSGLNTSKVSKSKKSNKRSNKSKKKNNVYRSDGLES